MSPVMNAIAGGRAGSRAGAAVASAAAGGAAVGWVIKLTIGTRHPAVVAGFVLVPYGVTYFAIASLLGLAEAKAVVSRMFSAVGFRGRRGT